MQIHVTTHHLEMTDPAQHRSCHWPGVELKIERAHIPCPELNRFLYTAVGGDWYWVDRLVWSYEKWRQYLDRPELGTWVAYQRGTPAGYFELEAQPGANVELAYFGLLPQFVGRGLGGPLLSAAIDRAWQMGAVRVWVHTCNLDHPGALANYEARGFRVFKVEEQWEELPDRTPGPWPGADRAARSV